jgi:hypothetical protein
MSEEKDAVQSPNEQNDQVEADQISTNDLDAVAGGVLALQQMEGSTEQAESPLSSLYSLECICIGDE